jgi:hypothetical protein
MTRYQVAYVGHVTLKVAAAGEGVVMVVLVQVDAPKEEVDAPKEKVAALKEVGDAGPAESDRERRQVQELSRIDDRVGQSEKERNPHVSSG